MARKQAESKFISEFKKSVKFHFKEKAFFYKIIDSAAYGKENPKPFDAFMFLKDGYKCFSYAIEFKSHTKYTAWPLSSVTDNQFNGLKSALEAGAMSYVILNVRFGTGKNRKNFMRIFKLSEIHALKISGVKSLKVDNLEFVDPYYFDRIIIGGKKEIIWNLSWIIYD